MLGYEGVGVWGCEGVNGVHSWYELLLLRWLECCSSASSSLLGPYHNIYIVSSEAWNNCCYSVGIIMGVFLQCVFFVFTCPPPQRPQLQWAHYCLPDHIQFIDPTGVSVRQSTFLYILNAIVLSCSTTTVISMATACTVTVVLPGQSTLIQLEQTLFLLSPAPAPDTSKVAQSMDCPWQSWVVVSFPFPPPLTHQIVICSSFNSCPFSESSCWCCVCLWREESALELLHSWSDQLWNDVGV